MTWRTGGGGAFLVTLFVLLYLLGNDLEGWLDGLIVLLIATAVGVGVGYWLDRDPGSESPDVFDERATRRAVRRGIVRTALATVVWGFLGVTALSLIMAAWQMRGDRDEHFALVAINAFKAANPGYEHTSGGCCSSSLRSIEAWMTASPRSASGLASPIRVYVELDLRGRLRYLIDVPETAVDVAVSPGRPVETKPQMRERLDGLPDALVATAVVELARPVSSPSLYDLLARYDIVGLESREVAVYLQPRIRNPEPDGYYPSRVSWPSPSLAAFQHWVKQLRDGDDRLLQGFRLPSNDSLRRIATDPRIHGFILERATPVQLQKLLADSTIRSVSVGEVAFDLGHAG